MFINLLRRELSHAFATPFSWLMPLLTFVTINFLLAYTIKPQLGGKIASAPEPLATMLLVSLIIAIITSATSLYPPHQDQGRKLGQILLLPASPLTFMSAKIIAMILSWWVPLLFALPLLANWWGGSAATLWPYIWRVILLVPAISSIVNLLGLLMLGQSRANQLMLVLLPPLLLPLLILVLAQTSLALIAGITMCIMPLALVIASNIYRDVTSMLG